MYNNTAPAAVANLDDLLFLNRNKNYGAYELRKNYDKRLTVALLAAVSFFIIALVGLNMMPKPKPIISIIPGTPTDTEIVKPFDYEIEKVHNINPVRRETNNTDNIIVTRQQQTVNLDTNKMMGISPIKGGIDGILGNMDGDHFGGGDLELGNKPLLDIKPKPFETSPDQDAQFPGGENAYENYLKSNIKYPTFAVETGVQGIISLSLKIDEDGNVVDVKVDRRIGGGCDEEAVRVVKAMPRWRPGRKNGEVVPVIRHIRVHMLLR